MRSDEVQLLSFSNTIEIIGINPFVHLPKNVLNQLFIQAGRDKSPIPIKGTINGKSFIQTLVKYQGVWRFYVNETMLTAANSKLGDRASFEICFDPKSREIGMHPKLRKALDEHKQAKKIYDGLAPSLQREIVRYISFLKTEAAIDRNVERAIGFLMGKGRFIGRDHP
ncbi:MAG: YdeI/OmpD-associated family protein [Marinoscillum sp.]